MLINPKYKILNKELTSVNASQYRMSINVKIDGLSLLIIDDENIINAFNYQWQTNSWDQALENISEIINNSNFIQYNFKASYIFIDSQESMMIPKDFYSITKQQTLLETYIGNKDFTAYSQKLNNTDSYLVFGVYNKLSNYLRKQLPRAKFYHNTAMNIENTLANNKFSSILSMNINSHSFEIIASKNSDLLAYNTFNYKTLDEFMFFVLSFVKQNNFDTNTVKLILNEPLLMTSSIALQLKKYFSKFVEYKSNRIKNEVVFDTLIKNTISANN